MSELTLTPKQKLFCEFYIERYNATDAAIRAGYSENTASEMGYENLNKPHLKAYIDEIQEDLGKIAGISKLRVLKEHEKIAFSSIAHLHKTWIEKHEFDQIEEHHKDCIKKIEYKTMDKPVYNEDSGEMVSVTVEFVKVELYDKHKSLDSIAKMLGHDAPSKVDLTSNGKEITGITVAHPGKED